VETDDIGGELPARETRSGMSGGMGHNHLGEVAAAADDAVVELIPRTGIIF
jgi:hypothetical protein